MARKVGSIRRTHDDSWLENLADIITKPKVQATINIVSKSEKGTTISYSFNSEKVTKCYGGKRPPMATNMALEEIANKLSEDDSVVFSNTNVENFIREVINANQSKRMSLRTLEAFKRKGISIELIERSKRGTN